MSDYRIGHGYDVHAFGEGTEVILGGVRIAHDRGLVAHSDGDVLIHALCDALLGALALGDIGTHFPDSDPGLGGVDSRILLRDVIRRVREAGYAVNNADLTAVAQAPRLGPHIPAMRGHLAGDLEVETARVSIKATTTERLGFVGREEGIAAHAVVLLKTRL